MPVEIFPVCSFFFLALTQLTRAWHVKKTFKTEGQELNILYSSSYGKNTVDASQVSNYLNDFRLRINEAFDQSGTGDVIDLGMFTGDPSHNDQSYKSIALFKGLLIAPKSVR